MPTEEVTLRGVVEQKLGRCLIRLQQYELLVKDFVVRARIEGPASSISETQVTRAATVTTQTLGQVMGTFVGTVLEEPTWDADGFPSSPARDDEGVWISSGYTVTFSEDVLGDVKVGLTELVALRNHLVHGFVLQHDLLSEEGCVSAAATLDHSYGVIDRRFNELRDWYKGMLDLHQALGVMLADAEVQDRLASGMGSDGNGLDRRAREIVELLRHAETELSRDGWTLLDDAVAFILRLAPEQSPRRYGWSTWRQVLHESRPAFAVRRAAARPGEPRKTWYQSTRPMQGDSSVST